MNVLFVFPNIDGNYTESYSFGVSHLVSIIRERGYKSKVLYLHTKDDYQSVLDAMDTFKPSVLAFSSVSSQFLYIEELALRAKEKFPKVINVCGGVHPTLYPETVLGAKGLDGIFVGDGDTAFPDFLDKVKNGESYKESDNFAYEENGKLVKNKLQPRFEDLDSLPYPDKELSPYQEYIDKNNYAPFFFARGCPFDCSFCSNHAQGAVYGLKKNDIRYRSPENCIGEIEDTMKKFRFDKLYMSDDIFGLNAKWKAEFLELYKKRIKIPFIVLLRADIITEALCKELKEAGCCRISIGVESGNEFIRTDLMDKGMSNDQIIKAFDTIHAHGIETNSMNIIGVPGETDEMLWDTIKLNRRLRPTMAGVSIFYPYRGTRLGDKSFEEGLVNEERNSNYVHAERRSSILNYSQEKLEQLTYYEKNWQALIYPYSFRARARQVLEPIGVWSLLRKARQALHLGSDQ